MKDHQSAFVKEYNIKNVDKPLSLGPTYYKQTVIINKAMIDALKWGLVIDFSSMTKGIFRWNSFCCGRYYSIQVLGKERDPSLRNSPVQEDHLFKSTQRYYHIPKGVLQERNELEVFEEIGGNFMQLRILTKIITFSNNNRKSLHELKWQGTRLTKKRRGHPNPLSGSSSSCKRRPKKSLNIKLGE
ncbi:Beta-galactosidase 4 [Galdieria sulphuraria]|nr:Beta-galactosidase 4 [Galdieria sulphuraria]